MRADESILLLRCTCLALWVTKAVAIRAEIAEIIMADTAAVFHFML